MGVSGLYVPAHDRGGRLITHSAHEILSPSFGGEDGGKDRAEKKLESSVKLCRRPRKPSAKSLLVAWAEQWSHEDVVVEWQKTLPPKEFVVLTRRWVVERTFVLLSHDRKVSLGTTRVINPLWALRRGLRCISSLRMRW
jgi:hypothetical protein